MCRGPGVLASHPLTASHSEPVTVSELQRLYPLLPAPPKL